MKIIDRPSLSRSIRNTPRISICVAGSSEAVVPRSVGADRSAQCGPHLPEKLWRILAASVRSARFFRRRRARPAPGELVRPRAWWDEARGTAPGKSAKCAGHGFVAALQPWPAED